MVSPTDAKREFVAVYDYGQGGLWFAIAARTRHQIEQRFPFLKVFDEKPVFVTWDFADEFRQDIDLPEGELLAKIQREISGKN